MSVAVRRGRSSVHVGCTPDSDRKFDERVPVEKGQGTKSLRDSPLRRVLEPIGR